MRVPDNSAIARVASCPARRRGLICAYDGRRPHVQPRRDVQFPV